MATTAHEEIRSDAWSPARMFLAVSAVFHLPVAIAGLMIERTFPFGSAATVEAGSAYIFGVLETNGWHSLAALLVGLVSAWYALRPAGARRAALALGGGHVLVVVGLLIWAPSTFWLASNTADQVVHASTALGGITAGLLTRAGAVSR